MAKMTKEKRKEMESLRDTLQGALKECEACLKADDEEAEKSAQLTEANSVKSFAGRAQGRAGTTLGILAARELGRPGGPKQ